MALTRYFKFDQVNDIVALEDCDDIISCLPHVFSSWPYREVVSTEGITPPRIFVRKVTNGFAHASPWNEKDAISVHPVDAACTLVADVVAARVSEQTEQFCLHAAAVEIDGKLVVFPSTYRAGKSFLTATLAGRGRRVFGDDILRVSIDVAGSIAYGHATGVAPRLRLPIPHDLPYEVQRYFDMHIKVRSPKYAYLDLPSHQLASYEEVLPIGGFVVLDRQVGHCATELIEIDEGEMLRSVVWQNFARARRSSQILDELGTLVRQLSRCRLRYSSAADAAAVLENELDLTHAPALTTTVLLSDLAIPSTFRPHKPGSIWLQQSPGVTFHRAGSTGFLADATGDMIFDLNHLAAAVWDLLAEPMTIAEAVTLVAEAFPDTPGDQISGDIAKLCEALTKWGLVRAVEANTEVLAETRHESSEDDKAGRQSA